MAKSINALELRKRFGEIMDEVRYKKEPYIVKKNGREVLVLMDIEAYHTCFQNQDENAFIEMYTDERIKEFNKEDKLDAALTAKARKLLGK